MKGNIVSVVPYFFVRCQDAEIAGIEADVSEIHWLKFTKMSVGEYDFVVTSKVGESWFSADTGVGAYGEAVESELAKRLVRNSTVLELRIGWDVTLPGGIEVVDRAHRLVAKTDLEFGTRSWLMDENGRPLLDHSGKVLSNLDFKHQRMAILAQAFNAVDSWLSDEQWSAVDEWMKMARLGGMK